MKIAVLTSGGVDSSVALKLLQEQGHEVTAFYLKVWLEDELSFLGGECPWEEDLGFVRAICDTNNIPLEVMPMQKEYWDAVVAYTIAEVKAGRTPNPDVMCNNRVKFGFFMDRIGNRFEKVATGHYAQVFEDGGNFYLKKTPDAIKDQTYFLAHLSQNQLARSVFPIGHLAKTEVRDLAKKFNLPNQNRKDSQGICFLGKLKFSDFIKHHLGEQPGALVEYETGKEVAQHRGFWFYTLGQRKDIRLSGGPWYVVAKDPAKNIVYISRNYHAADKARNMFEVSNFNWFGGEAPQDNGIKQMQAVEKQPLEVKIRHGAQTYPCTLEWLDSGQKDRARVTISGQDQGIAPGQFAVFYRGDVCLGSGVIL